MTVRLFRFFCSFVMIFSQEKNLEEINVKQKALRRVILGSAFLILFAVYTWSLTVFDVRPIGPNHSCVGYASLNGAVRDASGVCLPLYVFTDWAGVAVILVMICFALLGLSQWIRRKRLFKVDSDLLLLGAFYLFVLAVFLLFEDCVVNYRPVLIDGNSEASYPSSTTMLSLCVLPTAMMQVNRRMKDGAYKWLLLLLLALFCLSLAVLRFLSGVHWLTDIIGGMLFSVSAVLLYAGADGFLKKREEK